eukprot:9382467-Lingulodinium_polyedra.AAC.1
MGLSWALFFCHEVASECARRAQASAGLPQGLLCDRTPPPPAGPTLAVAAPCVDNGNFISGSPEGAE